MNKKEENNIIERLKKLPDYAKKEVLDFIDFLSLKKRPKLGETLDVIRREFTNAGYSEKDIEKALKAVKTK